MEITFRKHAKANNDIPTTGTWIQWPPHEKVGWKCDTGTSLAWSMKEEEDKEEDSRLARNEELFHDVPFLPPSSGCRDKIKDCLSITIIFILIGETHAEE